MSDIARILSYIDENIDQSLERLDALLRIPSVSTDPAYADDCKKAAEWLALELETLGFDASVRDTAGHPMVVGHLRSGNGSGGRPHVLFYGHYDVQPFEPLELWRHPPFEPQLVTSADGRRQIVARGAADDKGQLMTFLEAVRAWRAVTGDQPLDITVLFEGEEECGSPSLPPFMKDNREELTCDLALVCDTNMWDAKTPAITTMLRGLLMEEVVITAASRDLHSGYCGGAARNPIRVLARILADIHDEHGRITIPGFYDDVIEMEPEMLDRWAALGLDPEGFLGEVGLAVPAGERDRMLIEQVWSRPSCDVNGILGGYTGTGTKTVIPSRASAKVSFRLVPGQDPQTLRAAFREFVEARLPADCSVAFIGHGASPAIEIPLQNSHLDRAARALEAEFGAAPVMMGCGGSIPIVGGFKSLLGMDSLLIGFGLADDQIHSPNEKYDVASFHHGIRSWARIIEALAG